MQRCLLTFKSVHYRLTAQEILSSLGILIEVVPVPPDIRTNCDKTLEMDCQDQSMAVKILESKNVGIERVIKIVSSKPRLLERVRNKNVLFQ